MSETAPLPSGAAPLPSQQGSVQAAQQQLEQQRLLTPQQQTANNSSSRDMFRPRSLPPLLYDFHEKFAIVTPFSKGKQRLCNRLALQISDNSNTLSSRCCVTLGATLQSNGEDNERHWQKPQDHQRLHYYQYLRSPSVLQLAFQMGALHLPRRLVRTP